MRTALRPTCPRAHLLAWLLLASMAGIAHARESAEVATPAVGGVKLVAHFIPVANELPGHADPRLLIVGLRSTEDPPQHAKAAQANAHRSLARHMRFASRTPRQAATWHKPTRLWHWRRRRWKKQSQPPAHRGTRSDQKLHRSEITLGLDRRADAGLFRAEIKNLVAESSGGSFFPAMQRSFSQHHCLSLPRQTMRPADFSAGAAQLCNP